MRAPSSSYGWQPGWWDTPPSAVNRPGRPRDPAAAPPFGRPGRGPDVDCGAAITSRTRPCVDRTRQTRAGQMPRPSRAMETGPGPAVRVARGWSCMAAAGSGSAARILIADRRAQVSATAFGWLFRTSDHTLLSQPRPVPYSRAGAPSSGRSCSARTRARRLTSGFRLRSTEQAGTGKWNKARIRSAVPWLAPERPRTHSAERPSGDIAVAGDVGGGGILLSRAATCMAETVDSSPLPYVDSPRRRCQRSDYELITARNGRHLPRAQVSAPRRPPSAVTAWRWPSPM